MSHQIERKWLVIPIFLLMFLLVFQIQTVFSSNTNGLDAHTETDNTSLSIWSTSDNGEVGPNVNVTFYANYTNISSGLHIPGATCLIKFDSDLTQYAMTDNGVNYNYTKFFSSGFHTYNIICSKTGSGFNTLSAVDNVTMSNIVPEFGSCMFFILSMATLVQVFLAKKKN